MNHRTNSTQLAEPLDIILADVAIRVQLSRTDYNKAVGRYKTINEWIERQDSSLKDSVQLFYPQGSMAVGATIASKLRTDEFDIDIVAQLDLPSKISPNAPLDLLFEAIKGRPGTRYYEMTKRRTRCVTVDYSDDMHIDVTPVIRRWGTHERESWLFHDRPEMPRESSYRLVANPYGFKEWFIANTPPDNDFAEIFETRAAEYEQLILAERAESEPVRPQEPPFRKSPAVIVLQLLKRWRNVQYDTRPGRRPPSILIAKLVADAANHTKRLSEGLLFQAKHILCEFQRWHNAGQRICAVNPVCEKDVLTDRWPVTLEDQAVFIRDLESLVNLVELLVQGVDLGKMREIMVGLFGETPTMDAFRAFNEQVGNQIRMGQSRHLSGTGRLVIPVSLSDTAPADARATQKHTFYGEEEPL